MAKPIESRQGGMLLVEVLVTVAIVSFGLLGIGALFVRSQQYGDEAYQRFIAVDLARQMAERISANPVEAAKNSAAGFVTGTSGTSLPGASGFTRSSGCDPCDGAALASLDLTVFHDGLVGDHKKIAGANAGGIDGARGCVEFLGTVGDTADPPRYRVSVVWQGRAASAEAPEPTQCGVGLYGAGLRRVVSLEVNLLREAS